MTKAQMPTQKHVSTITVTTPTQMSTPNAIIKKEISEDSKSVIDRKIPTEAILAEIEKRLRTYR